MKNNEPSVLGRTFWDFIYPITKNSKTIIFLTLILSLVIISLTLTGMMKFGFKNGFYFECGRSIGTNKNWEGNWNTEWLTRKKKGINIHFLQYNKSVIGTYSYKGIEGKIVGQTDGHTLKGKWYETSNGHYKSKGALEFKISVTGESFQGKYNRLNKPTEYIWNGKREYNEIDPIEEEELDNSKKSSSGWLFLGVFNMSDEVVYRMLNTKESPVIGKEYIFVREDSTYNLRESPPTSTEEYYDSFKNIGIVGIVRTGDKFVVKEIKKFVLPDTIKVWGKIERIK